MTYHWKSFQQLYYDYISYSIYHTCLTRQYLIITNDTAANILSVTTTANNIFLIKSKSKKMCIIHNLLVTQKERDFCSFMRQ